MKLKRILVPVDFSKQSLRALDYAIDLARPTAAELVALFVIEPIYYAEPDLAGVAAGPTGGLLEQQRSGGEKQLERLRTRLAKRRIALRTLLQTGTPYQVIVDTAQRLKADLIVISTHGRTGLSHLLMGSVAERVVRAAACPVLTIRVKS
jgi:nucleotide-binding universal stress UspA family protein